MGWLGQHLRHIALLDHIAIFQNHHPVGEAAHHIQVVGDEQNRHAVLLLQAVEQIENLLAQRNIQRSGGLVCQQQLWLSGQGHGDHGALALSARQLMRVTVDAPFRLWDACVGQQFCGLLPSLSRRHAALELQDLRNLVANGEQRVERGHGLLKNHSDIAATHLAQLRLAHAQQIGAIKQGTATHPSATRQTQEA